MSSLEAVEQRPVRPKRPTRDLPPPPPTAGCMPCDDAPNSIHSPSIAEPQSIDETESESTAPSPEESTSPIVDSKDSGDGFDTTLTPLRAHYLKKALLTLEFNEELTYITSSPLAPPLSVLSLLGSPFTPIPRNSSTPPTRSVPFLRFMFRQFVLTFPFLASAPKDFFPGKLQPFVDSLLARNLSSELALFPEEDPGADPDQAGRTKALAKIEKHLALLLGSAVKLEEKEEVVRLTQKDLDRLEGAARRRQQRTPKEDNSGFSVNIVSVRTISEKGRVRRRHHEEFVIRTRSEGFDDIFVSRRYGDFRSLSDELRKHHPGEEVPPPPGKDRSSANGQAAPSNGTGAGSNSSPSKLRPAKSTPNFRPQNNFSSDSLAPASASSLSPSSPLQRERNRLTLRSYLHTLTGHPALASSPVLRAFLTMNPINLSEDEEMDAMRREELDAIREEGKSQFEKEVSDRVDKLRDAVKDVKGDIMGPDGLTHVFGTIRATPNVADLPPNFKAVLEWGRISLASTIFHHFIASDSGSESLATVKRIHGLMPYFVLKGILRISNPVAMIRGVMDLFMAQPFGGRSLLQRMFTTSMAEEVKALEEEIEAVQDKVDDPMMCQKIKRYVYAPKEIQAVYKADAVAEQANLIGVILRASEEPFLSRPQLQRIHTSSRAHAAYIRQRQLAEDSDDDEGPEDDNGWLFEDLGVLIRLYAKLRDKEQMIELIFEGTTADLLRDIITIFYAPLAQVYKAASIADSLGDMQNFITDVIQTVERGEELSQEDPSKTVQLFIDLVGRHEQAFYNFVHKVHSKGEGLFDSLMRWIELFLTFVREGINSTGEKLSLEFILPHTGDTARADVLKEVDDIALYHYKLKVAYEAKVRKRFMRQSGAAAEEELAAQALVDNVLGELQFGSLFKGDTEDIHAEDEDEGYSDEDEDSSDDYTSSDEGTVSNDGMASNAGGVSNPVATPPSSQNEITPSLPPAPRPRIPSILTTNPSSTDVRDHVQQHPILSGRSSLDKPLPLPPPGSGSALGHQRTGSRGSAVSSRPASSLRSRQRRKVKRPGQALIEPPELKFIPALLPVFVELIRSHLQSRPISTA